MVCDPFRAPAACFPERLSWDQDDPSRTAFGCRSQSLGLQSNRLKAPSSRGFVGYGDADPSNTSPLVRGAEMRVAETRAVNRALRKAYGIGLC